MMSRAKHIVIAVFFLLLPHSGLGQVVSSVSFAASEEGEIVVQYLLSIPQDGQTYEVSLQASSNGGGTYFTAKSIRGDVGKTSVSGWKRITWDVLSDVETFEGDNCIVKVVAVRVRSSGDVVADFLFGGEEVRYRSNGLHIGAGWTMTSFPKATDLRGNGGYDISLRYTMIPLIIDADYFMQKYSIPPEAQGQDSPGISSNGFSASVSTSLFPIANMVVPFCGVGYQASSLFDGTSGSEAVTRLATNAMYGIVGCEVELGRFIKLMGSYRIALFEDERQWRQLILSVGCSLTALTSPNM